MVALQSNRKMSVNQAMTASNGSYELYNDKSAVHQIRSLEEELHSPPGGPSLHPPGSPKMMRDVESMRLTLLKTQQESNQRKMVIEDLQRRLQMHEPPYGGDDFSKDNSVDEDMKDSQIRHLRRQVTILQAGAHKKEGLEKRMIEMTKEKNLADDRLRSLLAQLEAMKKESLLTREQLVNEIKKLKSVVQIQKEEIERLTTEKGGNNKSRTSVLSKESYDSASPPSSSSSLSSPAGGVISLQSASSVDNQLYSRELDSLHKMVDMLRATVMEQRNVFVKLGLTNRAFTSAMSQNQHSNVMSASMPSSNTFHLATRPVVADAINNIAITNGTTAVLTPAASVTEMQPMDIAMTARPVRQAEENCEMVTSHSDYVNTDVTSKGKPSIGHGRSKEREVSPSPYQRFPGNEGADGNTNHLVSVGSNNNQQQFVQQFVASGSNGMGSPKRSLPGSESSTEKLNGNATSIALTALSNDKKDDTFLNSLYKHGDQILDNSTSNNHVGSSRPEPTGRTASPPVPVVPARKTVHSEVIDRRPNLIEGVTLPVKSRTETFGQNPNHIPSSHHHQQQQQQQMRDLHNGRMGHPFNPTQQSSEIARPQYPPAVPTSPRCGAEFMAKGGGIGRNGGMVVGGIPGGSRPSWQNSHFTPNQTAMLPPFEAEGCVLSPTPTNHSNTLSNISDVRSSSLSPTHSQQQRVPERPQGHNNSSSSNNRLCPVCNQDFGHISMEDFQTHVFDCFDNDDGPETLQAEMVADYPPNQMGLGGLGAQGRSCPMCQQRFDLSVSQTEFEQHVHRHFGEEPFEEL